MIMQSKFSQMMKHWSEIGRICVELGGGLLCHKPLCGLQVGWRTLIKMFYLLDSFIAFPCTTFLIFLPLCNHHHTNVNVLLSNIYFPLKIFGIFYITTFSISHMWPYQIYVWINIIVSNEYWWENGIIQKNQKNLQFGVTLIYYLTCKRMNVWSIFSINSKVKNPTLHFFQILIQKIAKTPYDIYSYQNVSSCVLIFITHFSPSFGVKSRRWRIVQVSKQVG
jgi:hypothetical protein